MFIGSLYPKKVNEIRNDLSRYKLESLLKNPSNIIFEGKENIGKKTLIRAFLCSYWDKDKINFKIYEERINKNLVGRIKVANGVIEVNLVHFNVHDKLILSHLIEPFLLIKPHNDKPRFIIVHDIDKITESASKMLKSLSEKYYKWNIFIGTAESANNINKSIKSNFDIFKVPIIKSDDIINIIDKYYLIETDPLKKEKTKKLLDDNIKKDQLLEYINFPNGILDYSSMFYIFTNYLIYDELNPTVEECKTKKLYESIIMILIKQNEEEISNCKDILFDFYSQHYKLEYLISSLLSYLQKDYDVSVDFYKDIAKIDIRNSRGNRFFIHMECFVFLILKEIVLGKNLKRKSLK